MARKTNRVVENRNLELIGIPQVLFQIQAVTWV